MNKIYKILGIFTILAVILFSITACGNDPKGLAKQSYKIHLEEQRIKEKYADKSREELRKKLEPVKAKQKAWRDRYDKLSPANKKIANEELQKFWTKVAEKEKAAEAKKKKK